MEQVPVTELTDPQLADEFAETRLRMMAWKPNVNPDTLRFSQLSAELLTRQTGKDSEETPIVEGEKWKVPISAMENKTTITDPAGVYKIVRRLGVDKVIDVYSITLGNIRKILTQKQQAKLLKTERTGPREIREPVLKEARP